MEYLLSILIPTKNRKDYVINCVEEVLECSNEKVQIVVQDNSDNPWKKEEVSKFSSKRFEYYHEFGDISFVENFSKALDKAKGKYVCFIGDDDGIMPQIVDITEWMDKNNVDAVSQNISVTYFWPNEENTVKNSADGLLKIYYANANSTSKVVDRELESLFGTGGLFYLEKSLAKAYHGIVKKEYFDQIKTKTGKYINGLSPDIYASVALSSLISNVYVINYPITISGISPKSGGAASANGSHTGKLADAPHFKGHDNYVWEALVPPIYSVETIWADSAMHAARDMELDNIDDLFCYSYLLKKCKKKYPQFQAEYLEFEKKHPFKFEEFILQYVKHDVVGLVKRILKRLTRKKKDYSEFYCVKDIKSAYLYVQDYLTRQKVNIGDTIISLNNQRRKNAEKVG